MFFNKISLLLLINLEHQSDDIDLNTTSILNKEEITSLTDNDNYESWREWPDRLFPRYNTPSDSRFKPSWTIITKSKTIIQSDLPSSHLTPVHSSSDFHLSSKPPLLTSTIPNYPGESSSVFFLSPSMISSSDVLTNSYSIQTSFLIDNQKTSSSFLTPSIDLDSSLFTVSSSSLITQSTPLVSLNSINSKDFNSDKFSSSIDQNFIHPTQTINSPYSTVYFNVTDKPSITTPLPNNEKQYLHKTVVLMKELPEGMKNLSIEFEDRLKKVFKGAYFRLNNSKIADLNVQLHNLDWNNHHKNGTLVLVYSIQLNRKYLDNKEVLKLLDQLSNEEIKNILNADEIKIRAEPFIQDTNQSTISPKPDKISELLNDKFFNIDGLYFWLLVGLLFLITLICCFYLGMLVCWWKHRPNKTKFNTTYDKDKKDLNQLSPADSEYSSDTLNTDNFIRWRAGRLNSKQNLNKRAKSLFKDDLKSSSLSKLRRKEIGSSPSNEFEYISFSSDTTNSSLRDGSLSRKVNPVRHHPYSQDYNRNLSNLNYNRTNYLNKDFTDYKIDKDYQRDYQQDYHQDYHAPTIQKTILSTDQLNQPNTIKLLISRGVQNNLLDDYSRFTNLSNKKFPLEIPSFNSGYHGNNISVLNLSKEKLIPLNQYTSDSSSTNTSLNKDTIKEDIKTEFLNKSTKGKPAQRTDRQFDKNFIDSSKNSRPHSRISEFANRPESRTSEPKRLIKKEIIEEFETITTTTTFKNNNTSNINSPNLNQEATDNLTTKLENDTQLNEQTKIIINAIKDELKRFNTTTLNYPSHQSAHFKNFNK